MGGLAPRPVRGHELADRLHGRAGVVGFVDDGFIVNVHHDPVPGLAQGVECVGEQVTGDGLDDVLNEFPAVVFQHLPFLVRSDAPVGDGGVAPLVLTNARLHVGEPPARWQCDEHDAQFDREGQPAMARRCAGLDCGE